MKARSWVGCFASLLFLSSLDPDQRTTARELQLFRTWLDRKYGAYTCDDGPGRFRNETVEKAYDGVRFYFVLTHARGIAPPFPNGISVVARVEADETVRPLRYDSLATFGAGLRKIRSRDDARRAAAAVLILTLGDPGMRRWKISEDGIVAKRDRGGWSCTFAHDPNHASTVRFDSKGTLVSVYCGAPPVP